MLDIRPPTAPLLYAFGHPVPAEVLRPGAVGPTVRGVIWTPSRAEFDNVSDVAVLDTMPVLGIPLLEGEDGIPVGTRVTVPAPGSLVPRVWTVRKVSNSPPPDSEWASVSVAE